MGDASAAEIHHAGRPVIGVVILAAMGGQIASRMLSHDNPVYETKCTKAAPDTLGDLRQRCGPIPGFATA